MTETKQTYGTQLQFKITLDYQMVIEGEVSKHTKEFRTAASNAGQAAALAIAHATAPRVTNIVLRVSLDV
jgi:hypothetical protein